MEVKMFESILKKITPEMSKIEIAKVIRVERITFNKEIEELAEAVKSGGQIEEIIGNLKGNIQSQEFLSIVEKELREETSSFVESEYIRKLNFPEFCELMDYALENIVLFKESDHAVAQRLRIDREQFSYLVKFMNTANDLIITKRFTKNNFSLAMIDLFRLDTEKIEYIWNLFVQNREQLTISVLLGTVTTIRRINNNIDFLNKIFAKLEEE